MKFKIYVSLLISIIPLQVLKIYLYNKILGYDIDYKSRIGLFNVLDLEQCILKSTNIGNCNFIVAKHLECNNSFIRHFNVIIRLNEITLGNNSAILRNNLFTGTKKGVSPYKDYENLFIGTDTLITKKHLFDFSDSIVIGDNVVFAGEGIQVWTHGFDCARVKIQGPINIGSNVYVGSRATILQNVNICDNVSIGACTTVSKSITQPGFYISQQLVRKSELQNYKMSKETIKHNGLYFLRLK